MKSKKTLFVAICLVAMVLILMGCTSVNKKGSSTNATSDIQATDQQTTADQFKRLFAATPPPELTFSLERQQLVKRLERFNDPSKVSYIYLISFGKIMAHYVVKGKVSSVDSRLTCTQQMVADGKTSYQGRNYVHVVDSPALDGSYGTNGGGIFFFTDTDAYVEWHGDYMLCDQPLKMEQPPELVMPVVNQ